MEKIISIEGMSCEHCVKAVTNALKEVDGVEDVSVSLEAKNAVVKGENLDDNKLKGAVEEAGYDVVSIN
ncbi:copper chaperone [Soehngenia longivitae]|jgi:copper chaperone|uniref:Copper chaperone n=1 Tax=Soehngenia longivitae TaxID=2562294 RepID=A0A4Z0D0U8_9FIRM|nr:heavy-metal-associated domain-containing protein [Soehngenia longivitae]TFZ39137.1 copper chaperone [Soehngenia longivitae]